MKQILAETSGLFASTLLPMVLEEKRAEGTLTPEKENNLLGQIEGDKEISEFWESYKKDSNFAEKIIDALSKLYAQNTRKDTFSEFDNGKLCAYQWVAHDLLDYTEVRKPEWEWTRNLIMDHNYPHNISKKIW